MKNSVMENIKTMLLEDSHRWQCPKYSGLVVVHPDMVEDVFTWIRNTLFTEGVMKPQRHEFTFDTGAILTVVHMEGDEGSQRQAEHNHAGMEYTSIMFSSDYAGGEWLDLRSIKGGGFACMNYMMTRCRSASEHVSKFVMM